MVEEPTESYAAVVKSNVVLLAVKTLKITPEIIKEHKKLIRKEGTTFRVISPEETIE